MTSTHSTQVLSLQMTPMQLLESSVSSGVSAWRQEAAVAPVAPTTRLRLCPGEPSELVVQITNLSRRPLRIALRVNGYFPGPCLIDVEGGDLPAEGRIEALIRFDLERDFLEHRTAIGPDETYQLDYQQALQVYATGAPNPDGSPAALGTLLADAIFTLHVRPDSRYLNFLPTVYREVDLLGRLLKIFEQSLDPAIQTLEMLWAYLDPLTAPEALLPFLAYWVGWPSDVNWSTEQQRQLIRRAMEIYRWRGTRQGLKLYLQLYTGLPPDAPGTPEAEQHISIQETFNQGFVLDQARLDENTLVGGGRPYHFIVRLRSAEPLDEELIRTIIEQEKPIFCTYELYLEART